MKPTAEDIGNLLALKRHERPEEGYFDGFVKEFHQRMREEESRRRGLAGWWQRTGEWFSDLGASKWAYAGGLAYATVAAVMLTMPREQDVQPASAVPVIHEVSPPASTTVEQLDALDLRPSSQGSTGEQEF